MPVQMIELEEVKMVETTDESLEATAEGVLMYGTNGTCVHC